MIEEMRTFVDGEGPDRKLVVMYESPDHDNECIRRRFEGTATMVLVSQTLNPDGTVNQAASKKAQAQFNFPIQVESIDMAFELFDKCKKKAEGPVVEQLKKQLGVGGIIMPDSAAIKTLGGK